MNCNISSLFSFYRSRCTNQIVLRLFGNELEYIAAHLSVVELSVYPPTKMLSLSFYQLTKHWKKFANVLSVLERNKN